MQHISGGDISANSVEATGAIASSLAGSSRGRLMYIQTIVGYTNNTWTSETYTPTGEALKYSTFLVNIQTAFLNSNASDLRGNLQIDICGGTSIITKYIPYWIAGPVNNTVSISCNFIIDDFKEKNITVIATLNAADGALNPAYFVPSPYNFYSQSGENFNYTYVDIIGLA